MVRRLWNWILGIPKPETLEARRQLDAEHDLHKTQAITEANRGNWTGKGPGRGRVTPSSSVSTGPDGDGSAIRP
jgi:hypothetical protein